MDPKKHAFRLLIILLPVFLIGYSLELAKTYSSAVGEYFEIATELLPLVLAFSIFIITWLTYRRSRNNHSLFLGCVFLLIGIFDLYHMLSYPFMPDFITPNSIEKSAGFWIEARLISALLILASVYIYENTLPKLVNKSALFVSVLILLSVPLAAELVYPEHLLAISGTRDSSGFQFLMILTAAIMLLACYLYMKRFRESKQESMICLIYSFLILIFSDLVYNYYDYSGHLLKAASFYFVYVALFKSSVVLPFEKQTQAERKLRYVAEEKYRSIVDNANDAIITTDLEGRITSWNHSAENIFGWTEEEVTGKKLSQLTIPNDLFVENELLIHSILLGKKVTGIETVYQRRDCKKIDVNLTFSPLHNMSRKTIGLSCIIRDITDRKHIEEIQHENMRLAMGIRTKSEFLTALSHDLGTPLNAMMGFSELLKQRIPGALNMKQEQYIENIISSSRRMLDIINDVLDLGRAETGKIDMAIEKIPVSEVIDEISGLFKENIAKRNLVLKKEFDPELIFIEADRQRFKQIIFNLISNAVKYSKPEGGTVTIKTIKEGDEAKISVTDTGIGIKEEDMGKLFMAFEQLNLGLASKYGSTGLGLVVTKKLVELHGGRITVESRYGQESTFTFYLPAKKSTSI